MSFPIYSKQHEPHNVPVLVVRRESPGFRPGQRARRHRRRFGPALGERSYRLIGAARENGDRGGFPRAVSPQV